MKNKKFAVGLYGGCFDPLHIGHITAITNALIECDRLIVVLSYNEKRDRICYKRRIQWLNYIKQKYFLDNVDIFCVREEPTTKNPSEYYNLDNWLDIACKIKDFAKDHIDVVYVGESDKSILDIYAKCYPTAVIQEVKREIPCSSTEIYNNPINNWKYIPNFVKPDFTKKVLIVGGESTGKSMLVAKLAEQYETEYVSEYGKEHCILCGGADNLSTYDAMHIVHTHCNMIYEALSKADKYLFLDTDAVTTAFYVDKKLIDYCQKTTDICYKPDLVFWLDDNVPFIQDGTRSDNEEKRQKFNEEMFSYYKNAYGDRMFIVSDSTYKARYEFCQNIINKYFK